MNLGEEEDDGDKERSQIDAKEQESFLDEEDGATRTNTRKIVKNHRCWTITATLGLLLLAAALIASIFGNKAEATATTTTKQQQQNNGGSHNNNNNNKRTTMYMETTEIAPGVFMPVVSIGTGGTERADAKTIVSTWLKAGGRGIDTALNYNNQEKIGAAITEDETAIRREDLFITTKIPGCSNDVRKNVEEDLAALGTDYVDLMLIHNPRGGDCLQAWRVLETYYARNITRAIGVSNFRRDDLLPLLEDDRDGEAVVPHVNQILLNVFHKDTETIDFSASHGITIQAYSPLGRNGRHGDIAGNHAIQKIAANHNASAYQVALRWILQHGWMLTFQSSSEEHQISNANVFRFNLTEEEMDALDEIG